MVAYRYPLIAREGWLLIAVVAIVAVVLHALVAPWAAMPLWSLAAFLCYLYRDPARSIPPAPLAIVSPVDGKVLSIETKTNPQLDRETLCIQLKMQWYNVFSARSPLEGKVMKQWLGADKGVTDTQPDIEACKNKFAQWIQSDEQDDVMMVVKPVSRLHSPRCYVLSGERIGQGQRCGIVPFGALVDVYVPLNSKVDIKVGDHVRAGSDTLATLVH